MDRKPPVGVRRELRKEVGFGCPYPGCGSPYLEWHHFDPPWRERQHHDPAGMIALCTEHHRKADGGAFTKDQLREFKDRGVARAEEVKGKFDWLRRDLLAVVGDNLFYNTPIIFNLNNHPVIWFKRDEDGYMLLNVRMLSMLPEPRAQIEDNFWIQSGDPEDLESPPSAKLLSVKYPNGDSVRVRFFELESAAEAAKNFSESQVESLVEYGVEFPITAVEVHNNIAGTNIEFGPGRVGPVSITGSVIMGSMIAVSIGPSDNVPFEVFKDRWNYDPDRFSRGA